MYTRKHSTLEKVDINERSPDSKLNVNSSVKDVENNNEFIGYIIMDAGYIVLFFIFSYGRGNFNSKNCCLSLKVHIISQKFSLLCFFNLRRNVQNFGN